MAGKGIVYQNQDVLLKIMSENYQDVSLEVYGLTLPRIMRMLPTNLPNISLDEKRADNVFLLEDNSILVLEYESSNDPENLIKYGHYVFRLLGAYKNQGISKVNVAVVYTGEVTQAEASIDTGCVKIDVKQVFLSQFDGQNIYESLKAKIEKNEPLSEADVMQFILLPLTEKKNKQALVAKSIELAKGIDNEKIQRFIIAGMIAAADKFVDEEYAKTVKEWLRMTKVGRLFEEEKIEFGIKTKADVARILLSNGVDILEIMKATGFSKSEILALETETPVLSE